MGGEKDKAVSVSVIAWHCSVLTLLDYMGQRRLEYSDITGDRKIHAAIRRSLNSSEKQVTIADYFSIQSVV
jgi:hypothetical protein